MTPRGSTVMALLGAAGRGRLRQGYDPRHGWAGIGKARISGRGVPGTGEARRGMDTGGGVGDRSGTPGGTPDHGGSYAPGPFCAGIIRGFDMKMIAGLLLLAAFQDGSEGLARFQLFNECGPTNLIVEGLPPDAAAISLTRERVVTLAESRLRAARLFSVDRVPSYLYVNVNVVGRAFSIRVGYNKRLFDPITDEFRFANTWNSGSAGTTGASGGNFIMQGLSEHLDSFVLEYLRVNEDACR